MNESRGEAQPRRLLRQQRLGAEEVSAALKSGRRIHGRRMSLYCRRNGLSQPRLALIVPKKLVRTAVRRNRIKRLAREVFRLHQEALAGLDCIVRLVKAPGVEPFSYAEMKQLFEPAFHA